MINYSFSTVFMTVITSTILIGIIALCFCSEKVMCSIGNKLIAVLFLFTAARLLFPLELPFSRNIIFPEPLSFLVCLIRHPFYDLGEIPVSFWTVTALVWACGIVYKLINMIIYRISFHKHIKRYGIEMTDAEPYYSLLRKYNPDGPRVRIISVPGLDTPSQSGIFNCKILFPGCLDIPEEAVPYIICHELHHFRHRDCLYKLGIHILRILYWWNPLCIYLENKLDLALELRVDQQMTKEDTQLKIAYFSALADLKTYLSANREKVPKGPSYLLTPRAFRANGDLSKRALINFHHKGTSLPLCILLASAAAIIYLCSYRFTFEPRYILPPYWLDTPEVTSGLHAVPLPDGTYNIYWKDILCEHVDSLEYYGDIPVEYK